MKNKHPHHDLIVEWAKDTRKKYQCRNMADSPEFKDCTGDPTWSRRLEYREKPREFTKGHWYPCIFNASNSSENGKVMMFTGENFKSSHNSMHKWYDRHFSWIGESLGEIEFGGGE